MTPIKKPIITICSSANFYKQAVEIQEQLEKLGLKVVVPITATRMKASGDFDVAHYKTWFADAGDYHKKAQLMRGHFDEITKGDAILVLNYEKHGKQNYIGPNVLMEMALAFYQQKPIFIVNELPVDTPFEEELKGMMPVVLHGRAEDLPESLSSS
jgi:ABC-type transport system substrate-binding protein